MRRALLFVLGTGLLASAGAAQESSPVTVGLGVALDAAATPVLTPFGLIPPGRMGSIIVPVRVARRIRLQPSVGFLRTAEEQTSGTFHTEEHVTVWNAAVAFHYLFSIHESAQVYLGPSVGLNRLSASNRFQDIGGSQHRTAKRTDTVLGAVAGGEYFLASRFSVGGEAQLSYLMIGDPKTTVDPTPPPPPVPVPTISSDASLVYTNAQLVVRWYFNGR